MDLELQDGGLREHWCLDPEIVFLNHGSFGACPRAVLDAQQRLRERMEAEPVRFFVRELQGLIDGAREALAAFVGTGQDQLALVPNATYAVNSVLGSLALEPGDELVTTDHAYNACRNVLEHAAGRCGARVRVAHVPFPLVSPADVVDAVLAETGERTRLALVDHVTSQTGMVWPVERLVTALNDRGIDTLVDGAHAPGMLPLELDALGAAYYTGNCHKWLCAPKGAGFLAVRPDRRDQIHPAATSHGYNAPLGGRSRFHREFDYTGTDDPTAWLCIPVAIEFLQGLLPGGWPVLRARNRALIIEGRRILCQALGVDPPCPEEMLGSLASVPLPDGNPGPPRSPLYLDELQDVLLFDHGIEVPVIPWPEPPKRLIRISAQIYNHIPEYQKLADALSKLLDSR